MIFGSSISIPKTVLLKHSQLNKTHIFWLYRCRILFLISLVFYLSNFKRVWVKLSNFYFISTCGLLWCRYRVSDQTNVWYAAFLRVLYLLWHLYRLSYSVAGRWTPLSKFIKYIFVTPLSREFPINFICVRLPLQMVAPNYCQTADYLKPSSCQIAPDKNKTHIAKYGVFRRRCTITKNEEIE